MTDLRDFLNWFDGFAENIGNAPNTKQWAKIKERVAGLQADGAAQPSVPAVAKPAAPAPQPAPTKPRKPHHSQFKFIIDEQGYVKRGSGQRVLPEEVVDVVHDFRGEMGELRDIIWADDRIGLNGADLTIEVVL